VQYIGYGTWKVSGVTFGVNSGTQIYGRAVVGSSVRVEGYRTTSGALFADEIVVQSSYSGGGGDD
jgi:hypothetical protein